MSCFNIVGLFSLIGGKRISFKLSERGWQTAERPYTRSVEHCALVAHAPLAPLPAVTLAHPPTPPVLRRPASVTCSSSLFSPAHQLHDVLRRYLTPHPSSGSSALALTTKLKQQRARSPPRASMQPVSEPHSQPPSIIARTASLRHSSPYTSGASSASLLMQPPSPRPCADTLPRSLDALTGCLLVRPFTSPASPAYIFIVVLPLVLSRVKFPAPSPIHSFAPGVLSTRCGQRRGPARTPVKATPMHVSPDPESHRARCAGSQRCTDVLCGRSRSPANVAFVQRIHPTRFTDALRPPLPLRTEAAQCFKVTPGKVGVRVAEHAPGAYHLEIGLTAILEMGLIVVPDMQVAERGGMRVRAGGARERARYGGVRGREGARFGVQDVVLTIVIRARVMRPTILMLSPHHLVPPPAFWPASQCAAMESQFSPHFWDDHLL
ncbi:hypothetical protein B0H13DRAFT_2678308 [Mycena leptocephala]|nr:hypothetical protein B0H13DRAFT_2678308 [Mycena leptocephala]